MSCYLFLFLVVVVIIVIIVTMLKCVVFFCLPLFHANEVLLLKDTIQCLLVAQPREDTERPIEYFLESNVFQDNKPSRAEGHSISRAEL